MEEKTLKTCSLYDTLGKKGAERLEIKGEVVDIIYQNEMNSYLIATFETEEELLTIVGYLPFVNSGDTLKLIGKFVEHKEYGRQFKVDTFEKLMPETLQALEKYLANGTIKGIGEATAKRIIKKFGEDTVSIFQCNPKRLTEIRGISEKKAKEMAESFIENWEVWQIVGFLERFGIGAEHAKKVYDLLGINAIEKVETDPYLLIDLARGVDFKQIDQMALRLGIEENNEKRIQSGIKYGLIKITYNGNTCTLKENLIEFVRTLLNVSEEYIENNLIYLKVNDEIVIEKREEQEWIYLHFLYQTEEEIARRLISLQKSENNKEITNIKNVLKKMEKNSAIELSERQKEAISKINENNVTIITGGPGTGKTTILKTIIEIFEERKKKVVLCAPTGRAAKKMTEATGKEASTLHRLLGIGKLNDEGIYIRKQENQEGQDEYEGAPIDADLIIIDELSMVDMFLMNCLLKCIYQGTKLVLVGDSDQLPSVGPGSVLKDIINSEKIQTVHLDKIFRQAAKSKIIVNAHRVNHGEKFLMNEEQEEKDMKEDFFFIKPYTQEKMLAEVISLCTGRLENYQNYDFFKNIQVLTPTKKGMLGTRELNKALQNVLNPNLEQRPEKINSGVIYRSGDRIMQVKNNYDIYWEKEAEDGFSKKEVGTGVFNGEMGTILEINEKEKAVLIQFDDKKLAWYEYSELDQIEHSYAITIHKAQRKRI